MPRISKLKAQRNRSRVNLYLDGRYVTSLELSTVAKLGLKKGMEISMGKIEKLTRLHDFEKLVNQAIRLVSYRPRSEKELKDYLRRKGSKTTDKKLHAQQAERAIEKLKKRNLINDREFADWWVQQRMTFRPKGKLMLFKELKQKGVSTQVIEQALEKVSDQDAAKSVAEKKARSMRNLETREAREKLIGFLKRRGFRWGTIRIVVDDALSQE